MKSGRKSIVKKPWLKPTVSIQGFETQQGDITTTEDLINADEVIFHRYVVKEVDGEKRFVPCICRFTQDDQTKCNYVTRTWVCRATGIMEKKK